MGPISVHVKGEDYKSGIRSKWLWDKICDCKKKSEVRRVKRKCLQRIFLVWQEFIKCWVVD